MDISSTHVESDALIAACKSKYSHKSVKFLQMQRQGPMAQTGTQTVEVTQLQCMDMRCGLRGQSAEQADAPMVAEECFDRRTDLNEASSHCFPRTENRERTGQDHSAKEIQLCKLLLQWHRHGQRRQTHVEGVHAAARDDLEELKRAHP